MLAASAWAIVATAAIALTQEGLKTPIQTRPAPASRSPLVRVAVEFERPKGVVSTSPRRVFATSETGDVAEGVLRGDGAEFSLASGKWMISCEGHGLWCPDLPWKSEARVTLPLREGVPVRGSFLSPGVPRVSVQARLALRQTLLSNTRVTVPKKGDFELTVPKERHHLRIAVPGYAPIYVWDFEPRDVERLQGLVLARGASIIGALTLPGGLPAGAANVSLVPMSAQNVLDATGWAVADSKGFFQLNGVAAGNYRLRMTLGDSFAEVVPLVVSPDEEQDVGDLELKKPAAQRFQMTPATGPGGVPWRLDIRIAGETEPKTTVADDQGFAVFGGLRAGPARLDVLGAKGDRLLSQSVEIGQSDNIAVTLPLVPISGRVTMGKRIVAGGHVTLMSGQSDVARLEINEEGSYEGWVREPPTGRFFVNVSSSDPDLDPPRGRSVFVKLDEGRTKGEPIVLDIDLGGSGISGVILDDKGTPVPRAVAIVHVDARIETPVVSDERGRFAIRALPKGHYRVWPRHPKFTPAGVVEVDLTENEERSDVRLLMRPGREVVARLVSSGQPVPRARVMIDSVGIGPNTTVRTSDESGRLTFIAPPERVTAMFRVLAVDQTLSVRCVPLPLDDAEIMIEVPPSPGGVLKLVDKREASDRDRNPAMLWSQAGGVFFGPDVFGWPLTRVVAGEAPTDRVHLVAGLAQGAYSYSGVTLPWDAAVQRACSGGAPTSAADWHPVNGSTGVTATIKESKK